MVFVWREGLLTFDTMPTDFLPYRREYVYRGSNTPYFAGHRGSTSPDGYSDREREAEELPQCFQWVAKRVSRVSRRETRSILD